MKVVVTKGLMFRGDANRKNMMDCYEADSIAQANDMLYAERITKEYDGKTLDINNETKKIISVKASTQKESGKL